MAEETTATRESSLNAWLAQMQSRPRLRFGVSFSSLHVSGFDTSVRFQHTIASYALLLPRWAASLLSRRPRDTRVQILRDFQGLVRDGEMLLVLGRPGSGCTTFLKALSGDTHGISIDSESQFNYQGISHHDMHRTFKGESIYLAELDVHFAELSVGDTLAFAAAAREKGSTTRWTVARQKARDTAALFGLDGAYDTWIGSAVLRGVSGGEKRRTSIAEALVGGAQLQCWDNSTRGLDSSTALKFVDVLRRSTDELHSTAVMSIYQASESIYEKFDKVMVLYEGRQIYFGPVNQAAEYFHELGFQRPPRATTPDFLTSLTNPAERIVRDGYGDRVPRSSDEFAEAWKQSAHAKRLVADIRDFNTSHLLSAGKLGTDTDSSELKDKPESKGSPSVSVTQSSNTTYSIPIYLQILTCLQRGAQRLRNQPGPVIGSVVANAILALIVGSVYYKLPETADSMDRRAILIFFSLLVTAYSPAFEVLTMWAQRPIVEKHDRYAFYHPFTDAASSMICDLPNKFATAALFHVTLYFMTNLRRTPGAFFIWLLFNFVLVLNMSMWFRLVGSISRTMAQSTAPTCIMVLLSCIYAGFVVPVPYMVGWLKWFPYVNPISYTYESLMINEFRNRNYPCTTVVPDGPSYGEVELRNKICPVVGAVAGQTYVSGDVYIGEKYTYVASHLWRNLGIIFAMTAIVCALHLLAAEFIPAERSKGDVLRFQRSRRRKVVRDDVEGKGTVGFAQDVSKQSSADAVKGSAGAQAILKQSSVFHWRHLSYDVKIPHGTKRILDDLDGWVKPGTLTALMGVTGSGKTTLLDVLANRASFGVPSGEVCIDGHARDASFQRKIGYAQQEDVHLPTATVREALEFSALLRQSNTSKEERMQYVDTVIQMLDMHTYADAVVGVPGDGLNIEQRKRLTIGVELVARPELLLFLDEPTSGLDSQTAWSICTLLRKLADNGQAVLCTIHQPSSQLFRMFDRVLLLNKNGHCIYFGDIGHDGSKLISYFEENGAAKCDPEANPAEWMLEVSDANNTKEGEGLPADEYWAQKWASSQQKTQVVSDLEELGTHAPGATREVVHKHAYAASWTTQVMVVTKRIFQDYWRSPTYVFSKLALCTGVALFNGLSFQNTRHDVQGLQNLIFSMFLFSQMFATVDQQVIPRLMEARALYESREGRSKSYSWTVLLASNILAEIVWQTLTSVPVFIVWFYPTGLWRSADPTFGSSERAGLAFMIIWMYGLWIVTFSQAMAAGIEHEESAVQAATLLFWFSLVFCGVMVSPHELPGFWKFVWRVSPLTYLIDGLSLAGLAHVDITCSPVQMLVVSPPNGTLCRDYFAPYIEIAHGAVLNPTASDNCQYCAVTNADSYLYGSLDVGSASPWNNVGYFVVFVAFNIMATFALYWLARVPKKRKGSA
ncbi:ABC multidrug transporter [Apiospora hydei]|uniref:ABC multidrug transporter n=1 Tax=Apiospora hydei TaxID=1337664 RepID=A0ABR1WRX3_9PEZI